ncbi:hypothetical protein ACFE04_018476 [Oxalis oulophora]
MPKRIVKKSCKQLPDASKEPQNQFTEAEVDRQAAAIRATQEVEIEHLLTAIRLLRSYINDADLEAQTKDFFESNLSNISIQRNEHTGELQVNWKDEADDDDNGGDIHASILRRMSLAYPDYSTMKSMGGFDFSTETVKTKILGADALNIRNFALEGTSDSQMFGMQDGLQTPGVSSQRMSIGMTPKTLRLPKPGEMLLSVRGSPLGVFKEDNMEAINGNVISQNALGPFCIFVDNQKKANQISKKKNDNQVVNSSMG